MRYKGIYKALFLHINFGGLMILIYLCSGNINVFNHETNSADDDSDAELVHVCAGWQRK
jgi:hypothetical protein